MEYTFYTVIVFQRKITRHQLYHYTARKTSFILQPLLYLCLIWSLRPIFRKKRPYPTSTSIPKSVTDHHLYFLSHGHLHEGRSCFQGRNLPINRSTMSTVFPNPRCYDIFKFDELIGLHLLIV